jgi:hypothetical protein
MTVTCKGTGADVSDWALNVDAPIETIDDDYDLGCAPFNTAREGSDVLIVRHASALLKGTQAGQIQVHSSLAQGVLFDDGVIPADFGADGETRDFVVDAYYVDNISTFSDTVPSLRRKTLVAGGQLEDQEMITGVENLQVQYGLDTNDDGTVERYVDPDSPTVTEGSPGFLPDAKIVAVRIWMLVRGEESPNPTFRDQREYQPLDLEAEPIIPGGSVYPAQFPRIEVTKTVFLRNRTIG